MSAVPIGPGRARAWDLAGSVPDPELPVLTLADLGVLREVAVDDHGRVEVTITPTYSGCPAMAAMRADLVRTLRAGGWPDVVVHTSLHPAWSTDWISDRGRTVLRHHGISPPGPREVEDGPVPLRLLPVRRAVTCPRCGSAEAELVSEFGPTACTAVYRCTACLEPFQHVKEI